jgi:hypothetical protein
MQNLYLCIPSDGVNEGEFDHIKTIWAESEQHVLTQLASEESRNPDFRDYVNDINTINWGFGSKFCYDEKGLMYDQHSRVLRARPDIVEKCGGDHVAAFKYIDQQWNENCKKFFGYKDEFFEVYIRAAQGEELTFSDELYHWCARHDNDWMTYVIREIDLHPKMEELH